MAAFNFPNSPSTNDIHTENNISWKWNGTVWKKVASPDTIAKADSKVQVVDAGTGGYITAETDGTQRLRIQNSGAIVTGILTSTTFVGALTGNASGSSGSCTGNAATATALQNARTIGGVSFDGTANINLPGVNAAGNQNTSGTSAGLSGTPAITVGAVTASTGQFSGNVNVLGTLTYEDVKNVDSAGIATARQGLRITGGGLDVVGVTTFNDNVKLMDSDVLQFGNGTDLKIHSDGSTAFLKSDDLRLRSTTSGHNYINMYESNGLVQLFYSNSVKLNTTSTGIKVHGGDQALVAQGSGTVSINIGSTNAGGAAIYFDGDSNGDFVGADYSHIIHNTSGHMEYNADNPSGGTKKVRFESTGKAHFWTGNNDYTNPDIGGSTSGVSIGKNVSGQIYACVDDSSGDYYKNWTMNLCRRNNAGDGPQLALDRGGWVKASIAGLQGGNTASSAAGQFAIYTHDYSSGSHVQTERFRIGTTGKVGIATDNPYAPLSVRTAAETSSSGNFADNGILLHAPGATDEHVIPISASFVTNAHLPRCAIGFISHPTADPIEGYAGEIGFYTRDAADGSAVNPSNERVRITRSGRIGIGDNNPDRTVDIVSATGGNCDVEMRTTNNTGWCQLIFSDTDAGYRGALAYNHTNDYMALYTSNTERFRLHQNSNSSPIGSFGTGSSHINNCTTPDRASFKVGGRLHLEGAFGNNAMCGLYYNCYSGGNDLFYGGTYTPSGGDGRASAITMRYGGVAIMVDNSSTAYSPTNQITTMQTALNVDRNGYVTKPKNPCVSMTVSSTYINSHYLQHNYVYTNIGSHYNTSTAIFTCPVAGLYFCSLMVMSNNTNTTMDFELHKNGGNMNSILVPYSAPTGGQYNQVSGHTIIECASGDELRFKRNNGNVYQGRHSNITFALFA